MKKVLDSISNDRPDFASPVELWDSANRAPVGRRTISDGILLGHRDRLVWLLSVTWPEIGSGLLAANTPEKLREAFSVLRGRQGEYLISQFLEPSSAPACKTKELRKLRKDIEGAATRASQAREKRDSCETAFRQVETAMKMAGLLKTDQEGTKNGTAQTEVLSRLDEQQQASLRAEYDKQVSHLASATRAAVESRDKENDLRKELTTKETAFAQTELSEFIAKEKYARNPLQLANVMAGLPHMTWEQSYTRCSKLKCTGWPNFQFTVFETIEKIWNRRHDFPELSPVQLFRNEIQKLPRMIGQVVQEWSEIEKVLRTKKIRVPNTLRSHLGDFMHLRLAIEEAVKTNPLPNRVPFLIAFHFGKNLDKPRTAVDLVLAAGERIE